MEKLPQLPETSNTDFALLLDKAETFLTSAVSTQNAKEVRIAEINKPIYDPNIELERDKSQKQHDAWTKVADANIAKYKREFRLGAAVALTMLLFLVGSAGALLIRGEYQFAFPIIT